VGDLGGKQVNPHTPKISRYLVFNKRGFIRSAEKIQAKPS